MDKTINQKAWFLVLPVFLVVAFSAILPLMTVVNYSMQDTFGNNQFFWNGVGWFKELLDPSTDLGSRFFIRIRENMGLAYYVGASQMQGLVPGLFSFYLGTDPQKIEPVKTALLDEIQKLASEGLTQEELARAKRKLIGQHQIAMQSNDAFGYQCALDELYGLGFDYYKKTEQEVNAVTLDETKRVAAKYFRDQPYVLATVRPPEKAAAAKQK